MKEKVHHGCQELANIFLQLRISERSGRGIIHIINTYGKEVFTIADSFIKVKIPFIKERSYGTLTFDNKVSKSLISKERILKEIILNNNITTIELMNVTNLGKTTVQKYIKELVNEGKIKRIGSNKTGYWQILNNIDNFK